MDLQGEVLLRRITTAADVGTLVNPDSVEAQLQGGLVFGLTAALYGEITIKNGRVEQSNFNDYRMLRIDQMPKIDVHLIKSGEPPGGVGETGTTAGPPALRNAIFAVTGVALKRLPIDRESAGRERQGMNATPSPRGAKRRPLLIALAVLVIIAVVALFLIVGPGPMAFSKGRKVDLADYHAANPSGVPAALAQASLIKKGEYLAKAADCLVCHTAKGGEAYAGGFAFVLPFGTLYSTNITPDKATGIGNYTDAQFLAAVHRGVRRDGANLYPAMPYTSYTYMTDADALAIKAYLFSLAPIDSPNKPNELAFPFNQRWAMGDLVGAVQCQRALQAGC